MKKTRRMAGRIFSLFLALVMLCTAQDITVFAQDGIVKAEDSLSKAKTDAKAELQAYAETLQSQNLYSNTALNTMNLKVVDGNSNIDNSVSEYTLNLALVFAKAELKEVTPDKTFDQIKQEAKEELAAYKSDEKESSEQKEQWENVIEDAGATIDGAENRTAVTTAVSNAKNQIDNLFKAPVTGDDQGLEQVRNAAERELDNYLGKFNQDDYDADGWAEIQNIVEKAKLDISTADVAALNVIVPTAKSNLDKVLTIAKKEQAAASEEKARKLQELRDAAIDELNSYRSKYNKYYSESMVAEVDQLIKNGINAINKAGTESHIADQLGIAKNEIEDRMKLLNGSALAIAKTKAKKELDNYKNPKDYSTAQKKELTAAINAGKTAIGKEKTTDGVEAALAAAKANIDKIKTAAQIKEEAAAAPTKTFISGKIKAQKKGFTVKWKKQTVNVDGYEVCYSTSIKFPKKGTVTKTITKKTTAKLTVKKLKAKKKYYVKVRTYKNEGGKKSFSSWSSVRTVITKK